MKIIGVLGLLGWGILFCVSDYAVLFRRCLFAYWFTCFIWFCMICVFLFSLDQMEGNRLFFKSMVQVCLLFGFMTMFVSYGRMFEGLGCLNSFGEGRVKMEFDKRDY